MEICDAEACDPVEGGRKRCGIAVHALRYRCGGPGATRFAGAHANELYRVHGVLGCAFELLTPPRVEGDGIAEQTCPAALHAMHCVTDVAGTWTDGSSRHREGMEICDAEACDPVEGGRKRCGIAVHALRYRCGGEGL